MATFVSISWTTGDIITEVKLDNMVSNSQSEDAHAANGMIMNNNVAYRAKQAGGTTKDVMKLGTDDILRLSQLRTQTDDADTIVSATTENILIQSGWGQLLGSAATSITESVTFPTTFGTVKSLTMGLNGAKSAANASTITDLDLVMGGGAGWHISSHNITTSGFTVTMGRGSSNFSNTVRYGYSWIAIGVKS